MEILQADKLTKTYGQQTVVDDINFSLTEHKCIALIGANGAGKTTTLRMITGLIKPTSGDISFMKNKGDYRKFIGYLPQHPVFHEWMTGEEYLVYAAQLALLTKKEAQKRATILLEQVGILDAKNKRIAAYSGGMKQRLGIAQAMIHQPKLLVLDEPVSALDPVGRREVLTLIETLKQEMTILFSTHILSDADEVCDDVLLLHKGKMVESGSMATLREKYKTSKIELVFSEHDRNYKEKLATLSTVLDITITRHVHHITVTDIAKARKEILTHAANEDWSLTSFTINRASLENMFLKVVQ